LTVLVMSPAARGVKSFQAETEGVHACMAGGAFGIGAMYIEPLPDGQAVGNAIVFR
jgi:hypothetical protein